MKQINKIATYLGFSIKSNAIIYGVDNITTSNKNIFLILIDNTLSENSKKKIIKFSQTESIKIKNIQNLEALLNKENCKAVALTNFELTKAILNEVVD